MKSLPGQVWLLSRPAPLLQITRWFSMKRRLQDWTDGPRRLGVNKLKPHVYTSSAKIRLLLMRRDRWLFNNRNYPLVGIPPFFIVFRNHASNLLKVTTRKNPPAVRLEPAICKIASSGFLPTELSWPPAFFSYQPSSVRGRTLAFLLAVHGLCGVIEGRLNHFLLHWLRTGWQSVISQGTIPWNTPPWLEIEPGP